MDIILLFLILGGITVCYFYLTRNYNYWRMQGIPCLRGVLPGLGNMLPIVSGQMNIAELSQRIYESYPGCSMVGFYDKTTPALVVRKPELVKTVLQTHFQYFSENLLKINPDLDPLLVTNPFLTTGETWVRSRRRVLHALSGKKLKDLFSHIELACKKLEDYVEQNLKCNNGTVELEVKDLFFRYMGETTANMIFSMEGFCFEDELHPLTFATLGKSIFNSTLTRKIVNLLTFILPQCNKIFRIPLVPKQTDRIFRNIVKQLLLMRQQDKVRRNDVLRLMADMEDTDAEQFDEAMIMSDVFSFFFNGFDTTSFAISMVSYQIARHSYVQQKLRNEVINVLAAHNSELTYESLKEMQYMDQVINESMRLHNVVSGIGKTCTKEFELKGSDGLCCRIQPGTLILVPTDGLHRDSKYWPDPDVFDPERFAVNEKREIQKYTYLPFGEGPRICPGKTITLLQMKACIATLVSKYNLEVSPRNIEPLKLKSANFLLKSIDGLWIYFKRL